MGKFQWRLCTEQLFLTKGEGASDSGEPGRHSTSAGTNRNHMCLRGSSTRKLEPFHVPTEDRKGGDSLQNHQQPTRELRTERQADSTINHRVCRLLPQTILSAGHGGNMVCRIRGQCVMLPPNLQGRNGVA